MKTKFQKLVDDIRCANMHKTVNQDLITLEDRNIDDIIINCYKNLHGTVLAAYSLDSADSSAEFRAEFKSQIDKLKSKYKDKLAKLNKDDEDERTTVEKVLHLHNTSESIDVTALRSTYRILKLKYFIDPTDNINEGIILPLLEKTKANWKIETELYQHVNQSAYKHLDSLISKYRKKVDNGEIHIDNTLLMSNINSDLFVKEQRVLLPVYNNDGKYVLEDSKYYGVFNNCDLGNLTKEGAYGVKVFKNTNGRMITVYMYLIEDVLFLLYFNNLHCLWHIVTSKDAVDTPMEEVFPKTGNPKLDRIFKNTYEYAKMLENNDIDLYKKYKTIATLPDPDDPLNNGRASYLDEVYVDQIMSAIPEYVKLMEDPNQTRIPKFEFLSRFGEELYNDLNSRKITRRNADVEYVKKRINLAPKAVTKVIKRGAGENVNNTLFINTSSEPNPFDIFYLLSFMKKTNHTITKRKQGNGGVKVKDEEKRILWSYLGYVAEFCPKSVSSIGIASTIVASLPSANIKRRKK